MVKVNSLFSAITLLCSLMVFARCTTKADYKFDFPGEKIVLLGQLSPQNGAIIYLQATSPPDETVIAADKLINDATVELIAGDSTVAILADQGGGKYVTEDYEIDTALIYTVRASHPEYPTAIAGPVTIPQQLIMRSSDLTFEPEEFRDGEFGGSATLDFTLQDQPGPSYYYLEGIAETTRPFQFQVSFISEFDLDFCDIQNYHPPHGIFWTDRCFDTQTFSATSTFEVTPFIVNSDIDNRIDYTHYRIRLRTLSYEAYRYLEDKKNPDDGFTVVEVPASYTNVTDGFGVLMAYQEIIWRGRK